CDAGVDRVDWLPNDDGLAEHFDRSGIVRVGPGDRPRRLRAPGAHEAGETQHLASLEIEADVVQHALAVQVLDREHDVALRRLLLWILILNVAADHELDN